MKILKEYGCNMTLTQLEYIIAIHKYGSFRKAANQLFVSQSTVSSQVRKLEKELGTDIFDRSGPVIRLTQAGAKLLYLSESMMYLKEEIEKSCSEKEKFRLIIYSIYLPIAARCFAEYIAGLGISDQSRSRDSGRAFSSATACRRGRFSG